MRGVFWADGRQDGEARGDSERDIMTETERERLRGRDRDAETEMQRQRRRVIYAETVATHHPTACLYEFAYSILAFGIVVFHLGMPYVHMSAALLYALLCLLCPEVGIFTNGRPALRRGAHNGMGTTAVGNT